MKTWAENFGARLAAIKEPTTYSPVNQHGGYGQYSSLTDLLTEGFDDTTVVEVDDGSDVILATIGELSTAHDHWPGR